MIKYVACSRKLTVRWIYIPNISDPICLASSAVDCGFEPRSGQIKDYEIGICCFSAKHVALSRKSKNWLAWIRIMCPSGATCLPADRCFNGTITIKIKLSVLV